MTSRRAADETTDVYSLNSRVGAYLGAIALVAAATVLTLAIGPWMGGSVSILFFPAVILPAAYAGFGPALLAAMLSTLSLAYFFIPPRYAINLGIDDAIRLAVFAGVAMISAWLSTRRQYAEKALVESMCRLERNVHTLQQVSGWPALIGPDSALNLQKLLTHAAVVVHARAAAVLWEAEDEPWVYLASTDSTAGIAKEPVSRTGEWRSEPLPPEIVRLIGDDDSISTTFETEHVEGRVYFTGVTDRGTELEPTVALVAHEIGNSLGQLQLAERMRQLAVQQDRIKVSRDLHDGVLQGLTGVRLELASIADALGPAADRLRTLERALAVEQRELRLFIDALRPSPRTAWTPGALAGQLTEMCMRLSSEWRIPVTVRVTPPDRQLAVDEEQAVRLMIHEGVSNALKHSHASRVAVEIDADDALRVRIVDDGLGFSFQGRLDHEALATAQHAPVTLRERVCALAGRMTVESHATGSLVEFVLPVRAKASVGG